MKYFRKIKISILIVIFYRFYIIPPSSLEIIEFVMEAEIGTPIFLNIGVFAERPSPGGKKTKVPFSKCKELPFAIKSSDANFFYNESAVEETVGKFVTTLYQIVSMFVFTYNLRSTIRV